MTAFGQSCATRVLLTSSAEESLPKFSPDGRWLAYVSNETGRVEVYLRLLSATGRVRPVSVDGGSEPVWAPDGRELFYREGTRMQAATIDADGQVQSRRVLFDGDFARGTIDAANYDVTPFILPAQTRTRRRRSSCRRPRT